MKIHITGMSPRMVSQRAREQRTFARTLEEALLQMEHEVYCGPEDREDSEVVLGGVTSALSPGATYALIGLEHIGRALDDGTPLLLYIDDPEMGKIRSGAQSVARDPERLYSAYLMSKRVKQSRQLTSAQRARVGQAIEMLGSDTWPPVLVPMHPWASTAIAGKRIGVVSDVVPLDVSDVLDLPELPGIDLPRAPLWLTDRHYSTKTLDPTRVSWPVVPIDSSTMPHPSRVYTAIRGIHQGAVGRMPGWWTPTPLYVAHARTVYLCDSEESALLGVDSPYYLTPDQVEQLDDDAHRALARAQDDYLKETMWTKRMLFSTLTDWIGQESS